MQTATNITSSFAFSRYHLCSLHCPHSSFVLKQKCLNLMIINISFHWLFVFGLSKMSPVSLSYCLESLMTGKIYWWNECILQCCYLETIQCFDMWFCYPATWAVILTLFVVDPFVISYTYCFTWKEVAGNFKVRN